MDRKSLAGLALFAFKVFCATVVAFAVAFTVYLAGPAIETRYFPVVETLVIDRMEVISPDKTRVWASFRKKRSCDYVGIAWFRGSFDNFERVPVVLHRMSDDLSSPNRPIGYQRAGPWDISVSSNDLLTNSFAILHHQCHGMWVSTTNFFP